MWRNALKTFVLCGWVSWLSCNAAAPDKSGVKPSAISLPSGAGSIEGLGESFEPQLNTGSSSYGVAIALPPGRAGLQPSVRLSYNSGLGNSIVGLGWSLEFPTIKRQTDKGFPTYTDNDVFVFQGEELVPLSNPEGDWRCENESAFQRFRQIDTDNDFIPDSWEMTERNGTRHIFGEFRGKSGRWSAVTHPFPPPGASTSFDRTYCWALNTTIDLHGNRIEYHYLRPNNDPESSGILYPSRITYSPLNGYFHDVRFRYEDRPDKFDDYRPTFSIGIGRRLIGIEVHSFYEGADHLVRAYDLEYAYRAGDGMDAPDGAIDLGVSTLKRIVQRDRSGNANNFLPPLVFAYSSMRLTEARLREIDPPELELAEPGGNVQIADVNGDSLPDIIKTGEGLTAEQIVCWNRGEFPSSRGAAKELQFSEAITIVPFSSNFRLSDPSSTLTDVDGDGLVDFVRLDDGDITGKQLYTFANRSRLDGLGSPGFSDTPQIQFGAPRAVSFSDPAVRQMDINFDKRSDFLSFDSGLIGSFYYYFRERDDGPWTELGPIPMNPDMVGFDFSFEQNGAANPEVHLADMNGDRLQDLVYLELSGSGICATLTVRYWPYCAIGRWGEMRVMSLATGDAFQVDHFDLRDLLVQDLTGDGLADIALLHSDGGSSSWLELRINIAGRQWSTPFTHANLPRYLPRDMFAPTTFRQADLNANGSTDLIWCNTGIENSFYWLDLLPGGKPNLLTRIDNSLGKVTEITYGNAVDDLIRARESQHPWQTWCPFPLQVVRRIRTTCGFDLDGVHDSDLGTTDQYLSEFRYRDAYFDGFEREFRGFAFAERIDYGDDVIAATNLVTSPMGDSWGEGLVRAPGWNPTNSPTGQVSSPTLVTRFRYLTGAADGRDNDEYPLGWNGALPVDEISEEGGREEEILKGRQVWEEKLDPWVLYNTDDGADFDRGCWSVFNSVNAAERVRMTPDQYVYSRIRQEWQIRRLYRPIDPALAPPGRFASASPEVGVRDGQGGSGRSVSFAFVSSVTKEIIEANGLLQIALAHPPRPPRVTAKASDYDDFGNLTLQRDFGVVAPGDYDDERFSSTEYSHGGEALHRWIIDKPARMRVTDENGVFVSETRNFYDGPAFQGLPLGTIGDRALLHRVEQIVTDSAALPALTDQSDRPGDPRLPAGSVVQKVRSQYDPFGNSIATLDPLGTPGNLAAGHARRIDYDTAFRTYPVNETIVVGGANADLVISADYDLGFGVITSSTDFNGNLTRYEYDSFARLVAIVKPLDSPAFPTATYEYSPADPNRSRVYQYDRAGNLTLSSSGSIRASSRVMTRLREVASQPGAHVMVSYTDGCGRKLAEAKESDTAGRWIISGAQSYNRRMGMQSEWLPYEIEAGADDSSPPHFGQVWPTGRPPTASLNGDPVVKTDKRADPTGREIITINPPETFTLLTNELTRARAITQILPLERRLFDENDSDPASPYHDTPMVQCLDGLGRLIKVLEVVRLNDDGTPSGTIKEWPTEYQYDLNDNLTHITDSQSNQKWFRYDGLQRKLFMNDPDRGVMIYTYDAASNLRETVDAKSQHIQYTYDGVNRLLSEDYLDALGRTPDVLYHYDVPDSNVPVGDGTYASGNNTKGMLAWAQDLSGEEHTSYDSRGRVESVIKRIPDPQFLSTLSSQPSTPLVSYRTGYAYDSLDRATTLTYPDNDQIGYAYNARNLLQKIIGGVNGLTRGGLVISNILYQPSDQLAWIDYGNGVRTTYGYDPRLRLNSLLTVSQPSTLNSQLINFTYDFDGVSNIRSISDNRPASAVPLDDPRRNTQVFAYDDLYRITRATYNSLTLNSPPSTNFISYSYDRIGNMLAQHSDIVHLEKGLSVTDLGDMSYGGSTGKSGRIGRASSASPGPHALTSLANRKSQIANREYPYDANGNMTLIDGLTNTWDFKDRLIAVENSEMRAEYTYDYADRRIIKRVAKKSSLSAGGEARGEVESVLYPDKYFEVREHDAPTKYVWNGNTRVARVTGSFTTNQRVQRFRLWPGWNLVSLAVTVTVTNALNQLRSSASLSATGEEGLGEGVLPAAVQWNSATGSWLSVIPTDALPAGTVLWINAATNCTAQVTGAYTDPLNRTAPAGASFQPGAGLEELPILGVRADIALWKFDGAIQTWRVHYATNLTSQSDFPATLAVGDGFMAPTDAPTTLEVPASELRIRYYHQDHLGSASVVTDSQGSRIADRYFYAFGHSRANANQSNITEIYTFTQKETDQESLLEYFGARFRCPGMSRFTSVDRLYENADSLDRGRLVRFLSTPQMLNLYSYCINRPVNSIDPNGLDWLKYTGTKLIWYAGNKGDTSKPLDTFKATSGIPGMQSAMFQNKKAGLASGGPLPEGSYKINLRPSPDRTAPVDSRTGEITRSKERGIEQIPEKACRTDGQCFTYGAQGTEGDWGNRRAALEPDSGNKMYGRGDFYVHDSDKGYTHGCIETESRFFSKLLEYRTTSSDTTLDVVVDYPKGNASTYGETDKNQK